MPTTLSEHFTENVGTPTVSDHVSATLHHDESGEPSAATDENKSSWTSTASAAAKLLLRGVRDSADAFGPLKSAAGGLYFILENCEVWSPSCMCCPTLTGVPANESEYTRNRIVGSSGQSARRIALRTCF
jgi:hypothetical protein